MSTGIHFPNDNSVAFGTMHYNNTDTYKTDSAYLYIEVASVFGGENIERK